MRDIKLNLGCANRMIHNYINIDIDNSLDVIKGDCEYLNIDVLKINKYFLSNSIDEIRAFHFMEHFTHFEILNLLYKFYDILKIDGKLIVRTPDFSAIMKKYERKHLLGIFDDLDLLHTLVFNEEDETFHKTIWNKKIGVFYFMREGFFSIEKIWHPSDIEIQFELKKVKK